MPLCAGIRLFFHEAGVEAALAAGFEVYPGLGRRQFASITIFRYTWPHESARTRKGEAGPMTISKVRQLAAAALCVALVSGTAWGQSAELMETVNTTKSHIQQGR